MSELLTSYGQGGKSAGTAERRELKLKYLEENKEGDDEGGAMEEFGVSLGGG